MSLEIDLFLITVLVCVIVATVYFVYKWWTSSDLPPATKKAGQACTTTSECLNGFCGAPTNSFYDKRNTVCCLSNQGVVDVATGITYCTGIPPGGQCYDDYTCDSGYCNDGVCASNPRPPPPQCIKDIDCGSGACAYASWEDEQNGIDSCCPSGSSSSYYTKGIWRDWCNDMPVGNTCWSDPAVGTTCKNGACGLENYSSGANYICCPSGNTELNAGFTYCTGIPNGQACKSNAQCASQFCADDYTCHERTS